MHVIVLVCWLESITALWLSCLPCTFCFVPAYQGMQSLLTSFTGLLQLILSFPSCFHSFLLQITLCFSFGSKDNDHSVHVFLSYRHSSFTLQACLCWRHIYCRRPIIKLTMNVSPPLAMRSRFIRMRVFHGVKNGRPISMPYKQETKRSSYTKKHFQRKSLKIFDLHPLPRLVSFVARINTWKVRFE